MSSDSHYQIIWLIRRLFRALGNKSDELLRNRGISSADRAVLEFLHPNETLSVPEIAKRYDVSRQHVQVTVNSLVEQALLETVDNPRHKRSPLVQLTASGRKLFTTVLMHDRREIDRLFSGLSDQDAETTRMTLQTLLDRLKQEATQ